MHFILGGVFERFPRLKFVITETGCAWVPGLLAQLDATIDQIRKTGQTGEIRYGDSDKLNHLASEYFAQNVWMGVSMPRPADVAAREKIGIDRFMWGSDYPHDEGTHPFTREHLRQVMPGIGPTRCRRSWPRTAPSSTTSTWRSWRRWQPSSARPSRSCTVPLDKLPDNPNEALLRSAGKAF